MKTICEKKNAKRFLLPGCTAVVLFFALLFAGRAAGDERAGQLDAFLSFRKNLFFDKYDVEFFLDDELVALMKHGEDLEKTITTTFGDHTLTFYRAGKHEISSSVSIRVSDETVFSCSLTTKKRRIVISHVDCEDIDKQDSGNSRSEEVQKKTEDTSPKPVGEVSPMPAEEATPAAAEEAPPVTAEEASPDGNQEASPEEAQRPEEESRKAEQEQLEQELSAAKEAFLELTGKDKISVSEVSEFASQYKDCRVQFDANIAWISERDDLYYVLVHAGDYDEYPAKGPDFLISGSREEVMPANGEEDLEAGMNVEIKAEIGACDPETGLLALNPVFINIQSESRLSLPAQEDYSAEKTVTMVQEALNEAGFSCGPADGIAGEKTRQAIEEYRASRNLEGGSGIDGELLAYLRVRVEG